MSLNGRTPGEWGVPVYRSRVTYVAQRPPALTGTADEWLATILELGAQRGRSAGDPRAIARTIRDADSLLVQTNKSVTTLTPSASVYERVSR